MNSFFSHHVGEHCTNLVEVRIARERKVILETRSDLIEDLTPAQAKSLGRALIKAGKFAEKDKSL